MPPIYPSINREYTDSPSRYMAGDDSDSDSDSENESNPNSTTKKSKKSDPAIYKASKEHGDDGVLFTMPAAWNRFSIVLRDSDVLKFVKYVSQSAKGDRWDIVGEWGVADDNEGEEGDVEEEEQGRGEEEEEEEEEEEWKGIEIDGEESEQDGGEGGAGNVEIGDDEEEEGGEKYVRLGKR